MKNLVFAIVLLVSAAGTSAQDWAKARLEKSSRHGEWVEFKSGERTIKAFVVYPERKDKAPVVLVIHEIFGLTDWVRGVCDQLAENGVIAITPDLLSGQTYADIDGARKAISALPKEQVKADLNATAEYAMTKIPAATRLGMDSILWRPRIFVKFWGHSTDGAARRPYHQSSLSNVFQRAQASSRAFLFSGVPVGDSPSRMKPWPAPL